MVEEDRPKCLSESEIWETEGSVVREGSKRKAHVVARLQHPQYL